MDMRHTLELDTLFDTVPNPVFIKDENLRFIFINKAYEKMFNVKRNDVIGKEVLELEYLPPEDRVFYQNEDRELLQHGKTTHHMFDYLYKGKEMHTCLYWSSGFVQKNGRYGVLGVIVDVNKQSSTIRSLRNKLRITNLEKEAAAKKSRLDGLTQLYTRATFDEDLRRLASSDKDAFSCIMTDIDHFKLVNDTFGHPVGDTVLREVASAMRHCSRKPDRVYRYGGEEFVVLLPETDLAEALLVAERIRSAVYDRVRLPDGSQVSLSAGCSEHTPEESGESVVQRADQALYTAKESGRNRVCS